MREKLPFKRLSHSHAASLFRSELTFLICQCSRFIHFGDFQSNCALPLSLSAISHSNKLCDQNLSCQFGYDSWGSGESSLLFCNDIDSEVLTVLKFGYVSALQHTQFGWETQGVESTVTRCHKYIELIFMAFMHLPVILTKGTTESWVSFFWASSTPHIGYVEMSQIACLGEGAWRVFLPPSSWYKIKSKLKHPFYLSV